MTHDVVPTGDVPAPRPARQTYQVFDPIPILDTARFEHMQRIAGIMARSNLVPEALSNKDMSFEQAQANCFLAVNQAVRWEMDPFAVAQCMSVVKGKLCFEGKLIAAVIESKLGIKLFYEWNDALGDALAIKVSGTYPGETSPRVIEGTVREWKTTHSGSPWANQPRKQLAYRGAREWGRLHSPGIMLGVYSDDEMEDLSHSSRSSRATDVTPSAPLRRAPSPSAAPMIEARADSPEPRADMVVDNGGAIAPETERDPAPAPAQPVRKAPSPSAEPLPQPAAAEPAQRPAEAVKQRYDPERVRKQLADALSKATTGDAMNDAWERVIDPWDGEILPPDREDFAGMYRRREAEISDDGAAS